jgi:hypothetical protein
MTVVQVKHWPVASLTVVSWRHAVCPVVRPGGTANVYGTLSQLFAGTDSVPEAGVNAVGPATPHPGPAGSPASVQR